MGAVNAAQLFSTLKGEFADWQEKLAVGDTAFVLEWLNQHIWQQASFLTSQELMMSATGEGSSAKYLLEHIEARYLHSSY